MRKNRQITRLERDVVEANAELLENQREYCDLEARMKDITNPVIPITNKSTDEPPQGPVPDRDGVQHIFKY